MTTLFFIIFGLPEITRISQIYDFALTVSDLAVHPHVESGPHIGILVVIEYHMGSVLAIWVGVLPVDLVDGVSSFLSIS